MRRDGVARMLLAVLVVVTAAGLLLAVQALERTRKLQLRTLETLRRLENHPAAGRRAAARGSFANAEYFQTDAPDGGTLRECIGSEPPNLNPLISNEAVASEIHSLCMSALAERDWARPDGEFRPLMAEKWEISPDRLSYRIWLRRGIKWYAYTDPVTNRAVPEKEFHLSCYL